jgi:hypothetical protein
MFTPELRPLRCSQSHEQRCQRLFQERIVAHVGLLHAEVCPAQSKHSLLHSTLQHTVPCTPLHSSQSLQNTRCYVFISCSYSSIVRFTSQLVYFCYHSGMRSACLAGQAASAYLGCADSLAHSKHCSTVDLRHLASPTALTCPSTTPHTLPLPLLASPAISAWRVERQ